MDGGYNKEGKDGSRVQVGSNVKKEEIKIYVG